MHASTVKESENELNS